MRSIEVHRLDLGESCKMVGFSVEGSSLFGGGRETPAKELAGSLLQGKHQHTVLLHCPVSATCRLLLSDGS